MKWQIDRTLRAPVPALPVQERPWPCVLTLGRPLFTLQPADDEFSRNIGKAIGDPAFSVLWEHQEAWENLPPPPWRHGLEAAAEADISNARYSEIAFALQSLPCGEMSRQPPRSPSVIARQLTTAGPLPARLREAFAFALFQPGAPLDSHDEVLVGWSAAVRATLHQRRPLARAVQPASHWLALGYRLLEAVSRLRAIRPALTEVEQGWQALTAQSSHPLPQVFALVYWGEGAHRLSECGDTSGATVLLARQSDAAAALIDLLPALAESLQGGLWRHHLGRLAYYRGDFPEALRQYQQEWRLQAPRLPASLQARLQRSISSVLTDMGLLASARRLAEAGLQRQQAADEPETFKTLGRLGEIHLRLGDYTHARECYEESWRRQGPEQQEGRTAVYLGHLALMEGKLTEAADWYQQAEAADQAHQIAFNPYRVMGRIALAWRQGDRAAVSREWRQYEDDFARLRDEQVLPAAVAAMAVALIDDNPALVERYAEQLLEANYLVEALYLLARCYRSPDPVRSWLARIQTGLTVWQEAVTEAAAVIDAIDPNEDDAPGQWAARIETALAVGQWTPLEGSLRRVFPMSLCH